MRPHHHRERDIQRVILIEGSANLCVLLAKLVVGLSTGSLAILSDAVHSLTDLANNIVAWFVIRLAVMPPDKKHPYGHKKFETLAVFFLATLLTVLAIELVLSVFRTETPQFSSSGWELGMMLGVLTFNIGLGLWQRHKARQLDSELLNADASHTLADALTTIAVIAGWQAAVAGYPIADKACALVVAGLVFYLALQLFKTAAPVLVDERALNPEEVRQEILKLEGVQSVRRIRSRSLAGDTYVDMVIGVGPALSTERSHDIADSVEELLYSRFAVADISIHVEPHYSRPEGLGEQEGLGQ